MGREETDMVKLDPQKPSMKKMRTKKSLAGDKKESERIFKHKGERRQKFKMKAQSLVRNNLR